MLDGTKLQLVTPERTYWLFCDSPLLAEQWAKNLRAAKTALSNDGAFESMDRMMQFTRDANKRLSLAGTLPQVRRLSSRALSLTPSPSVYLPRISQSICLNPL